MIESTPVTLSKTAEDLRVTLHSVHREKICGLARNISIRALLVLEYEAMTTLALLEKPWKAWK